MRGEAAWTSGGRLRPHPAPPHPLLPTELLLERRELGVGGLLHRGAVGAGAEQFRLGVGLGPFAAGRLEALPRRVEGGAPAPGAEAAPGIAETGKELGGLALGERHLVALHRDLPLQHHHPLAVPRRELPGDARGLGVLDPLGELPAALGIGQVGALGREFALRGGQRTAQVLEPELQVHERAFHRARVLAGVGRHGAAGQELVELVAQTIEETHGERRVGTANNAPAEPHPSSAAGVTFRDPSGGPVRPSLSIALLPLLACRPAPGGADAATCGFQAVAGATMVLSEFNTPGTTLSTPPAQLPSRLVARFVAGPARPAVVGRRGDSLEVGVDGGIPAGFTPGFGVLLADRAGTTRGVLIYDGSPILGAPVLGRLTVGDARLPLLGLAVDPVRVEDPRCPTFPDSTLR